MADTNIEYKYLVKKIAEDDNEAFRIFYDNSYFKIYKYASYFTKNTSTREDIVSDVFLKFWQNRKNNPEIDNMEGYLYILTKNTALAHINNKESFITDIDMLPQDELSDTETPENVLIREELSEAVVQAIDNLPERCRLIFLMAREEGLKYREIAEQLSISEKTVNAQMVIAIKKISRIFKKLL